MFPTSQGQHKSGHANIFHAKNHSKSDQQEHVDVDLDMGTWHRTQRKEKTVPLFKQP